MEEIWKDIPGYEGYYQVSNMGRVKSLDRVVYRGVNQYGTPIYQRVYSKVLSLHTTGTGYYSIMLHKEGRTRRFLVHRLVAEAFIANPDGKPEINHKDGNRKNLVATNLEWCNQSENILHASRILHTLTYHGKAVRCVETGEEFKSIKEAARHYGVADTNLGNAIRGKRQKTCAGYHWEFIS